jgi:hypothetical protein
MSDENNNRWSDSAIAAIAAAGFKTIPMRYVGQVMGSRESQTTTYWTADKNQVICGCFKGTLDEFETRVNDVYGSTRHGAEYKKYIAIVRKIMEMENEHIGTDKTNSLAGEY